MHAFRGNDAYPLSELQACVLAPQLAKLDERNDRRASRVELLRGLLAMRTGLASSTASPQTAGRATTRRHSSTMQRLSMV